MRRFPILAGAAAALLAFVAGADAQQPMQRVQVGVLECRGGASVGFIVGSVTNLGCVLRADGMPEDRYVATIRKVGLDLGITQESALAWGVFAPVARLGPGDLVRQLCRRAGQRVDRRRRSAATRWSAARPIRSRCSRSACRARSASASRRGWKAWNCGRDGKASFPGRSARAVFRRDALRAGRRTPARNGPGSAHRHTDAHPSRCTQRHFSRLPKFGGRAEHSACRPNHGPSSRSGGGDGTRRQKSPRSPVHCTGGPFPKRQDLAARSHPRPHRRRGPPGRARVRRPSTIGDGSAEARRPTA